MNPVSSSTHPSDPRRRLPAVSVLLDQPQFKSMAASFSYCALREAVQEALSEFRSNLQPSDVPPTVEELRTKVVAILHERELTRVRPVVNATGIILHTGLGRAVLPQRAVNALSGLNRCCNLQIDLDTGLRGQRDSMCQQLLRKLTGAEAVMLVNNNAAATFLILAALARDREIVISRGQLIEIGGSFRLPDVIRQSGARMVEVGTTNKTHLRDYEQAITDQTALILRVNPSNYRIIGFSQEVPLADLVSLKKLKPVLVVDDLGCGALVDLTSYGLPKEPTVPESIAAGADLVCCSGDKLIGGPQAGIILGKEQYILKLRKHPLSRMLRVGKLTAVALEHTLRLFLEPDSLAESLPTLRMLSLPAETLKQNALRLKQTLDTENIPLQIDVVEGQSATGGGSLPAVPIPTYVLAVSSPDLSPDTISRRLRRNEPPIIARISRQEVQLDMRTLLPGDDAIIVEALIGIAHGGTR
ncbi:MAG: L-seryl-tRNA(Sec) selenium transferase [Candidatus Omnitrophica bacterium]|nr:L-seryl-tRNA(Sec) selenium transferase [Candidatus Omnitrophota bacterium]